MVAEQLAGPRDGRDPIQNSRVLEAMRIVPRHLFVSPPLWEQAYEDGPLPIGHEQTLARPYIVALMTELADLNPGEKVLEIGTGSGYHTAVLAAITDKVFTVDIMEPLVKQTRDRLRELGIHTVEFRVGDGYLGWPERAPFDAIIVTEATRQPPKPLLEQLAPGGRLVVPIGGETVQEVTVLTNTPSGIEHEVTLPVRFLPMTGRGQPQDRSPSRP
ncbi:MAG: protein-L-isoaspartate(D-aspartate) O-methyltransferase [Candidatus Omnitrophica bacterium]|nr:protein-L-isoaspartate(D-aspartate) O-methyltransferase [Candidatus Omnitrophota bacterium]